MLGCVPFYQDEYRVLYTLVLPDPRLTQDGSVTFPACALCQVFVWSCDLAHDGLHCSHFCAYTHRSLLLHLSLVFAFLSFCSQEHQNVQPSTGTPLSGIALTIRAIHSLHYTLSNSYMMIRSPRLCSHWSPPRQLTTLRPQALCPAHSYRTVSSACSCGPRSQRHRRSNANFAR